MKRNSDKNRPKNLPSNESIAAVIKDLRIRAQLSQSDVAVKIGKEKSWVFQIEAGKINPIYFWPYFVYFYGKKRAIETYGIDWDLYRSDRVAVYFAYYGVNRKISCDTILGCSYATLRSFLSSEGKYFFSYQRGIDKQFPKMKKDQKKLSHYHLVGNNSLAEIDGDYAYVSMNAVGNRSLDTEENREILKEDIQKWIKWHKINDGKPEDGIIEF